MSRNNPGLISWVVCSSWESRGHGCAKTSLEQWSIKPDTTSAVNTFTHERVTASNAHTQYFITVRFICEMGAIRSPVTCICYGSWWTCYSITSKKNLKNRLYYLTVGHYINMTLKSWMFFTDPNVFDDKSWTSNVLRSRYKNFLLCPTLFLENYECTENCIMV